MPVTATVRTEVLLSGPCAYCGDPAPTQVDHIMPRSRGGTDDRDNLVPACKWCNMEKLDFTPEEYRAYREEAGLGWPPQSPSDFLKGVIAELRMLHPDADLARIARGFSVAYRDDPEFQAAEALNMNPDAPIPERLDALFKMREIRRRYIDGPGPCDPAAQEA